KTIGPRAFHGCSALTSVSVPDCTVGDGAFSACGGLETLTGAHRGIMDGILIIEDGKVVTCLAKAVFVTLPYTVTAIGADAFDGCTDLTYLFIPSTVTTIGTGPFDGIVFMDTDGNECTVSPGIYRGANGTLVKQIPAVYHAKFMFGKYSMTVDIDEMERLEAPPVVPDLPGKKFLGWEGFTEGMTVTQDMVFEAIYKDVPVVDKTYVTVTVVRNDGITEEYETEKGTNFRGPFSLYYTDMYHCNEWPINRAVENDMTLYAVAVLSGTCGVQWTFDLSTGVFTISGNGYMNNYYKSTPWYDYRPYILKVVVDPGVRSIGNYAFYGCKNLYDVTIADTVTSIGSYAFYHDYALEHVKLDCSNVSYGSKAFTGVFFHNYGSHSTLKWASCSGKEFVGGQGDLYCVSIGRTLSETVKMRLVLADKTLTFYGTGDIPDYGSTLNTPWYTYRYDIEHIVVGEGITSVPDAAFYKYTTVKTVVLADSVTSIGKNSLRGCTSLTEIVFGSGLQTIGSNALTGYTFTTSDGTALKVSSKNMAGHTFHNDGGTFVRD
ncbi:MAG: leucine-rich repeat domain-containing protein, partial [archaeon]|nr:leucine-rich repeat domain-containing protein [archaeon]